MKTKTTQHPSSHSQKSNLIIIVLSCSPNTPDDWKEEGGMCCKNRKQLTWTWTLGILAYCFYPSAAVLDQQALSSMKYGYIVLSLQFILGWKNKHISESNDAIPARAAPKIFMLRGTKHKDMCLPDTHDWHKRYLIQKVKCSLAKVLCTDVL